MQQIAVLMGLFYYEGIMSSRAEKIKALEESTNTLKKRYGIKPTPKKKKVKSKIKVIPKIKAIVRKLKNKLKPKVKKPIKRKRNITLPSGVRTKKQREEFAKTMGWKKK